MSNFQTRNLLPYAITRASMDLVELVYSEKNFLDDGSFERIENPESLEYSARVIDLQPLEIQRLQEGGITLNKGKNISIPFQLEQSPDFIKFKNEILRVIQFTPSEGSTVFLVDSLPGEI